MDSIRDQVKWFITHHVLSEESGTDEITDRTNLKETGILSSLWVIRLVAFLEERFAIHFDAVDFGDGNFSSIEEIERLVQSKQAMVHE
jgi:acyl carrier protein